jgi:hypothetical protein
MGQVLPGSARTTAALHRAMPQRHERIAKLAERDDLNPNTVAKWKKRLQVMEAPMGPKPPHPPGLSTAAVPYKILVVLSHGMQFTHRKRGLYALQDISARVCRESGIDPRLTKPNHPWANGQVEPMNRTFTDATVQKSHDHPPTTSKSICRPSLWPITIAQRLKTLQGLTP